MAEDFRNEVCEVTNNFRLVLAGKSENVFPTIQAQLQKLIAPEDREDYLHALNAELHRTGLLKPEWVFGITGNTTTAGLPEVVLSGTHLILTENAKRLNELKKSSSPSEKAAFFGLPKDQQRLGKCPLPPG